MKNTVKSVFVITLLGIVGKVLGLLRSILLAREFGSNAETDAFYLALSGVLILSTIFSNSLSNGTVMIISDIKNKKDRDKIVSNFINVFVLFGLLMMLVYYVMSPLLIRIMSVGFEGEQFNLAVTLLRIGIPAVIFYILSGIFRGYLNVEGSFLEFGFLSIVQNAPVIIYILFFAQDFGVIGLMVSQVIGIASQFFVQLPFIKKTDFEYKKDLSFRSPYLKQLLIYILPLAIAIAAVDLNTILDKAFASTLEEGSITALENGSRLNTSFRDLFIVPISLVLLPSLSRFYSEDRKEQFKTTYNKTFNTLYLLFIPLSLVLIVFSDEITGMLFYRGKFDLEDLKMTSGALKAYAIGLVPLGGKRIMNSVYYSTKDTKTSVKDSFLSLGLNFILNFILVQVLSYVGLALATSIVMWITFIILVIKVNKRIDFKYSSNDLKLLISIGVFAVIFTFLAHLFILQFDFMSISKLKQLGLFLFSVIIGGILYLISVFITNKKEVKELFSVFLNRKK